MVLNESLDTGPFDPWADMQIMLFAYSKILMQSLEMRKNHKTTHTNNTGFGLKPPVLQVIIPTVILFDKSIIK